MINKVFKTILVLTICLGLTIPTNAAVSVSDGSAFVTKAEFAADLNNLSNRMAQLENSLDAKIDSLVSSYLTRNGIWNGAKQDVSTFVQGIMPVAWQNTGTSAAIRFGNDELINTVIINELTKSGMLSGLVSYVEDGSVHNDNNSRWGYLWPYQDSWPSDCGFNLTYEFYEEEASSSNLRNVIMIGNCIGSVVYINSGTSSAGYANMTITLPSSYIQLPFTFFVSKGNKVRFIVRLQYHVYRVSPGGVLSSTNRNMNVRIGDDFYIY